MISIDGATKNAVIRNTHRNQHTYNRIIRYREQLIVGSMWLKHKEGGFGPQHLYRTVILASTDINVATATSTATNPTTSSNITVAPSNITAATFNTFTCITAATSTNITAAAGLGS